MIQDFPDIHRNQEDWEIEYRTQSFASELNGAIQTVEMPGAKWLATLVFNNRMGKDAGVLRGFLTGLRGRAGRFWLTPSAWQPLGTPSGTGVLDQPLNQGATIMYTRGWQPHQPELFCAGDWFEINGALKQVTKPAASDVNGYATIEFGPAARVSLGAGTQIFYDKPRCKMMLTDDSVLTKVQAGKIYSLVITCEEALDI